MNKIRISAVSYTNTKPFVYGLTQTAIIEKIDLSLDNPSVCAQKLIDNEVDIGLVPVVTLLDIPGHSIVSDYCIAANGAVNSVFIFSNKPISEVTTIQLDPQSRTSNALAKVLVKHYWKIQSEFILDILGDAFVEIGDRTFEKKERYPFVYDLALEWKNFTALPFVFAVWATNKTIPLPFLTEFNTALKIGIEHISDVIAQEPQYGDFDLGDYLTHKLDFHLTADKLKALQLFLKYVELDREKG